MATLLTELLADVQADWGEPALSEAVARRALLRGLSLVNADLGTAYVIISTPIEAVEPDLVPQHRELLILRALLLGLRTKRGNSATSLSFRSGDKQVTRSAGSWTELENALWSEYRQMLGGLGIVQGEGMVAADVVPVVYEQGSALE